MIASALERFTASPATTEAAAVGAPVELLGPRDVPEFSFDPDIAWKALQGNQMFSPPRTVTALQGGPGLGRLRVVAISDTHGLHRGVALPRGDILVHCGDFTNCGEPSQVRDLALWLLEQKEACGFQHVVVIAGNHDVTFHEVRCLHTSCPSFLPVHVWAPAYRTHLLAF